MLSSFLLDTLYIEQTGRISATVCRGNRGALVAIKGDIISHRRFDVETVSESVWVEVNVTGDRTLLASCLICVWSVSLKGSI